MVKVGIRVVALRKAMKILDVLRNPNRLCNFDTTKASPDQTEAPNRSAASKLVEKPMGTTVKSRLLGGGAAKNAERILRNPQLEVLSQVG